MADSVRDIGGVKVAFADRDGRPALSERDASDLVGLAMEHGARWLAIPAERLGDEFFRLASGVAGLVTQKFVNYGVGLAVIGNIAEHLDRSKPLRDYVYECNRGRHVWFLESDVALEAKLEGR